MKISIGRSLMSNIFDILRRLENPAPINKHYVYYDPDNGKVLHIRNYPEQDEYPFIELESEDLDLDNDARKLTDYRIVYRKNIPKLIKQEDYIIKSDVKTDIYKIDKIFELDENLYTDLLIIQDNQNLRFSFHLSKDVLDRVSELINQKRELVFYITAENDPNILYQTIKFPIKKIKDNKKILIAFNGYDNSQPCSIYTKKLFEINLHLDEL
jgi:hypothetical protein